MPSPRMPLTPADSTEIIGREKQSFSPTDQSFDLPPPAISHKSPKGNSHRLIQPAGPAPFSLPPPPTRSRKIIQVLPEPPPPKAQAQKRSKAATRATKIGGKNGPPAKKSQTPTSAAGKKIARKTAHSVIERRRRSKMNEEFGILKDMVPACKGQDMHKLAILQASIDYLRYLEVCISDLQSANNKLSTPIVQPRAPGPRQDAEDFARSDEDLDSDDELEQNPQEPQEDEEMLEATAAYISPESPSAKRQPLNPLCHQQRLPSPAVDVDVIQAKSRYTTLASASTPNDQSQSTMLSAQDEEASAALLMLNTDQRRCASSTKTTRGLSVKDLLSN